jgi:hypothetical protein
VLAWASGRKNRLVHISKDLVIIVKENTAVFVSQTKLRFLYWKFNIMRLFTSMHCFHHTHHSYRHYLIGSTNCFKGHFSISPELLTGKNEFQ